MNVAAYLVLVLYSLPGLFAAFTLHELAHAAVAMRLGDPTPRSQGRVTLNPMRQIDPLGGALLLMLGIGWAKPVQFSRTYIDTGTRRALVAVAGPLMNLVTAVVFAIALHLQIAGGVDPLAYSVLHSFTPQAIVFFLLLQGFFVNVILFLINILPLPGLDGFVVAEGLFGRMWPEPFAWMERNRWIVWAVALLIVFIAPIASGGNVNVLGSVVGALDDFFYTHFVGGVPPQPPYGLPDVLMLFS